MLRFFRKMRKSLVPENRFGRYFFYAVGEIVLVVIGILIALQINTWNQERINRNREHIALLDLNKTLETNIKQFNGIIDTQKVYINSIDILIDHIENKKPYSDSLDRHFEIVRFLERITIATSAYEILRSNGFHILSSNKLKMEVIQLFDVDYPNLTTLIKDVTQSQYNVISLPFFKIHFRNVTRRTTKPLNYSELLNNQEMLNILYQRRNWKEDVLVICDNLITKTEILMESIDTELQRFE